jgi:hypothetical protein
MFDTDARTSGYGLSSSAKSYSAAPTLSPSLPSLRIPPAPSPQVVLPSGTVMSPLNSVIP